MSLARRNLLQDKTRLVLSIAGVAVSIMLILILNGFLSGVYRQVAAYMDNTSGSVVVAQAGVDSFLTRNSILPPGTFAAARQTEGVFQIVPILSKTAIVEVQGTKLALFLIGYDQAQGGGPWRLAEGREIQADDEIILDNALAQQRNTSLGDRLNIVGREFKVVGRSAGTTTWALAYVFMRKPVLEALLLSPGATSYLLVTPSEKVPPEELRTRLESSLPGTNVLLKRELTNKDSNLFGSIYSPPLQLMVAIAFLVGALVVGLVIYTATVERQREYGVLKAVGASGWFLYRVVTIQALIATGLGAIVGIGLAFGIAQLIMAVFPSFTIAIEPAGIIFTLAASLVMALVAALFPIWTVARLAPAEVFKG